MTVLMFVGYIFLIGLIVKSDKKVLPSVFLAVAIFTGALLANSLKDIAMIIVCAIAIIKYRGIK